MRERFCKVDHNPPYSYGDCVQACIATMLDRDDVPHFFEQSKGEPAEGWTLVREWLATIGKKLAVFQLDNLSIMSEDNEGIPYMLVCSTIIGGHAVVGMNGKVVHDPSLVKRDLRKHPVTDSWLVFLIL